MKSEKSKAFIQKIVYMICFMWPICADWVWETQYWQYGVITQTLLSVSVSVAIWFGLSWKKERPWKYLIWAVVCAVGGAIGYYIWSKNPGSIFKGQYISGVFAVLAVGITLLRFWTDRSVIKDKIKKMPFFFWLWVAMSIYMLLSRHESIWSGWYLVLFGTWYLAPTSKETDKVLIRSMADATILGFVILQAFAFGFRPFDEVRYRGMYDNVNLHSIFLAAVYAMVLYRLYLAYTENDKWKILKRVTYTFLAGAIPVLIFFTLCRTTLIVVTMVILAYLILLLKQFGWKKIIIIGCSLLLSLAICVPVVYGSIRYLPTILHHPIWWDGEYKESKVHSFDPWNSEKYISWDEFAKVALGRFYIPVEKEEPEMSEVIIPQVEGTSVEESTEVPVDEIVAEENAAMENDAEESEDTVWYGDDVLIPEGWTLKDVLQQEYLNHAQATDSVIVRLFIWRQHIDNLNFMGHESSEAYEFHMSKDSFVQHAHNVFIQWTYWFGVPAGISFIILTGAILFVSIKRFWREGRADDLMVVLVWLSFVGMGIAECVVYPAQIILILAYLVPRVLLAKE